MSNFKIISNNYFKVTLQISLESATKMGLDCDLDCVILSKREGMFILTRYPLTLSSTIEFLNPNEEEMKVLNTLFKDNNRVTGVVLPFRFKEGVVNIDFSKEVENKDLEDKFKVIVNDDNKIVMEVPLLLITTLCVTSSLDMLVLSKNGERCSFGKYPIKEGSLIIDVDLGKEIGDVLNPLLGKGNTTTCVVRPFDINGNVAELVFSK